MNGDRRRAPGLDEEICPHCKGDSVIAYEKRSVECWFCGGSGCVKKQPEPEDGE